MTALYIAVKNNNTEMVKILLTRQDINFNIMYILQENILMKFIKTFLIIFFY